MTYGYHRPHHEKNIYVYVCICIYVHICICICTCIHRCIYAYTTRRTTPQQAPTHNTPHNPQIQGAFHLWIRVYVYVTYEYSRHTTRRAAPQPAPAHTPPHTSIVSATEIPSFDDPLDPPPKKNPPPPPSLPPYLEKYRANYSRGQRGAAQEWRNHIVAEHACSKT